MAGKWEAAAKENRYPGIDKWIKIWNKIYEKCGSCHIHFSGGEPFTYPDFLDFIIELSKKHTLEFSTNLSFDAAKFIEKIYPHRARICASFHPEFVNFEDFLEKALLLKENGFSVIISYVGFPPHLEKAKDIKSRCDTNDIAFSIQPFRGIFQKQSYPGSYTESEKDILKICTKDSYSNQRLLKHHTNKQRETKLCRMGQLYGKVYASADVYRCCSTGAQKIGNLLDEKDFQLLSGPATCEIDSCLCWKAMLVGKEEEYLPLWS